MSKKRRSAKTSKASARRQPRRAAVPQRAGAALSVALNPRKNAEERIAAMSNATLAVCDDDRSLQAMLDVLRSVDEPIEVRLAALASIQAASFSVVAFESCRSDYIATLRAVMDDADPELRQRVLGILAREKDGAVQKRLLDGLENPAKALVPPEKALQLLGYDPHASAYKAARKILQKPPNEEAKREALRLLAADTSTKPVFERILRDKAEASEYRQIAASALHAMAPDTLQKHAREIVLDPSESDEIRATSLTAISQFGGASAAAADSDFMKGVDRLKGASSPDVKEAASRLLAKYGRE
jgi:hypothetical protein